VAGSEAQVASIEIRQLTLLEEFADVFEMRGLTVKRCRGGAVAARLHAADIFETFENAVQKVMPANVGEQFRRPGGEIRRFRFDGHDLFNGRLGIGRTGFVLEKRFGVVHLRHELREL